GHLKVPALDAVYPASLSQAIIRGYLRVRSGFGGIVITDALDMAALTGHYSPSEAARLAIKAGADILLHPPEPMKYLETLGELARTKAVTKEDVMVPASRLQRAKAKYCVPAKLQDKDMARRLHKNAEVAEAIALRALTLVKAAGAFPALKEIKGPIAHICLEDDGDTKAGRTLRSALVKHNNTRNLFVTRGKVDEMRDDALRMQKGAALTIVSIFSKVRAGKGSSGLSPKLLELGRQVIGKNKRTVVVSFGSPYILKNFMDAQYVVAAYDPGDAMQTACYRAFLGDIVFMGELPVRING
ncbi:MAG: glycoside hydrolase family 3 N-terminal domain-containing protein, partial [Nitrospirota bacterium]